MNIEILDVTVPQLTRSLEVLKAVLTKAKTFADTKKIDMSVLLNARLAPDMFPLSKQIQIACDNAKMIPYRLSGKTAPKHADDEKTYEEFINRINMTLECIAGFNSTDFTDYKSKQISFPWYPGKFLDGQTYLVQFALPNFYFHLTTTYAILRQQGVELGKADFLGQVDWKNL